MAVLTVKMLSLLCGLLVVCLLAQQGSCRPSELTEDADADADADDSEYNADEPDEYEDGPEEDDDEDAVNGPPPKFRSQGKSISLRPGDTAKLPCQVENLGGFALMWLNGSTSLSVEKQMLTDDPRVTKHEEFNMLEITRVRPEDTGTYTCQITTNPVMNLTYRLMVTSPAKILRITPDSHHRTLKVGDPLTLNCETSGMPVPSVTWRRQGGKHLPGGKKVAEGQTLKFEKVTPHHAGTYECKADNGIESSAIETAKIVINYKPEVTLEPEKVRSGVGEEVNLMCNVHGFPTVNVLWLKDNKTLISNNHHEIINEGSKHKLSIKRLQKDDFGKYNCHAKNSIGVTDKNIEISGNPSEPSFIGADHTDDMNITLEWAVESFANIIEFKLLYRKKMTNDWMTEHPKAEGVEGNVYKVKHSLGPLSAGEYEAVLKARNEFGWSESETHTFSEYDRNGTPAAVNSEGATEAGPSSAADTRPRLLALMTVFILSAFFL